MTTTAEQRPERHPAGRRVGSALGNALLTVAALGGVICIVAVLAAWIFKITLIMFSTGSMSPTIPTGSVAIVRQIPAAEIHIGDVVTVNRVGLLPVTHRVRAIQAGPGDSRILTLRGDANTSDDATSYPVQSVRVVMFSIPKLATVIVWMGNPFVLGGITIGAALLVMWAFWPRDGPATSRGRRLGRGRHRSGNAAVSMAGIALLVGTAALAHPAPAAAGEPQQRVIHGRVITLTTIGDDAAMANMEPAVPVFWQVGITSAAPDPGRVQLSVLVSGALASSPTGLQLSVAACDQRWQNDRCASGATTVLPTAPAVKYVGGMRSAGSMASGDQRWLQVQALLPAGAAAAPRRSATVRIGATGFGDTVVSQPGGVLPYTGVGAGVRLPLLLGLAAIVTGLVLSALGRRRRPTAPRS
ncbi:MAG: signal peptidase I [Actinomycetota bacterium]|nr:signal peptidase I [Actinomycetota bacterium]